MPQATRGCAAHLFETFVHVSLHLLGLAVEIGALGCRASHEQSRVSCRSVKGTRGAAQCGAPAGASC